MRESLWFEIIMFLVLMSGMACIVFATWYDLRQAWLRRRQGSRLSRRPQVTAIITARSSEGLTNCIRSIRRLRYRQCDIIVTVPSSIHKEEKRAIRDAALGCRVYIARKQASRETRIRNAYQRGQRGELVLLLDVSQTIITTSLTSPIRVLQESSEVGVVFSPVLQQPVSVYGLAMFLGNLTWRFVMKAQSILGIYRSRKLFSGRLVRREVVTKPAYYRYVFDSTTALKGARVSDWLFLHIAGYVAAVLAGVVLVYVGTLAARLQTVEPLWLMWIIATLWMAVTIWLDDSLQFWRRVEYTLYLPVSYFVIVSVATVGVIRKLSYRRLF